jgi:serine/threonine protein kinase/tetratricopeptide (TPR) repeat protein
MNERSIFISALEIGGPAERAAYLNEACKNDDALRQRIDKLLRAHEQAGGVLDVPRGEQAPTLGYLPLTEEPGTVIGPYKLLQKIGEGGFGVVHMAEQEKPVRRRVAFKVIKPGMDSAQVIARFEAERQALALMDHQNIARVFDAGTTETGRPFFVMELVHGVPITKYCDDNHLTMRQRLELFVPVCQAIQHAHQKGIIHRDVKPSNVMVTLYDGKPVAKVIDFGVAKAIEQRLTERTMFTQYGQIIGTFEYMSPEQAEMSGLGVDTRSDIYSLGVLLYELLAGSTPLSRERLRKAALTDMLRIIKEEEPQKPSTRLSTTEKLATIAAQRNTDPAKLRKMVKGELDWIVMKCLEKDRTRRYETANGLGRDVQRYLNDEPVEACPPSAAYRLRKVARKHRTLLATATAFAVLLVGGAIVSAWLAARAHQAERGARDALAGEARERQEAETQRDRAREAEQQAQKRLEESQAARAKARERFQYARQAVDQFHTKVSDSPELKAKGFERLRTKLLETAAGFYEKFVHEEGDDLEVRAERGRAYKRLADLYTATGQFKRAEEGFLKAVAIQRELSRVTPGEPKYQQDLGSTLLGMGLFYGTRGKPAEWKAFLSEALTLRKRLSAADVHNFEYQRDVAQALNYLGEAYTWSSTGRSLAFWEEALAIMKPLAAGNPQVADYHYLLGLIYNNLGFWYHIYSTGHRERAEANYQQSVATYRHLGAIAPDTPEYQNDSATALTNLAVLYRDLYRDANHLALAETMQKEAVAIWKKMATDHPQVPGNLVTLSMGLASLASISWNAGHKKEAEATLNEALTFDARLSAAYGYPTEVQIVIRNRLGKFYAESGRTDQAESAWKEAMSLQRGRAEASVPVDGGQLQATANDLAEFYNKTGRANDSQRVWKEAVDLMNRTCTANPTIYFHRAILASMQSKLARHYQDHGQKELAIACFKQSGASWEKAIAIRQATGVAPDSERSLISLSESVQAYVKAEEPTQAIAVIRAYLEIARKELEAGNIQLAEVLAALGSELLQLREFTEAESLLRECRDIRRKSAPEDFTTFDATSLLGAVLLGQKKFAEAEPLLMEAYQGLKRKENTVPPGSKIKCSQALTRLVELYEATGRKEEAEKWRKELVARKVVQGNP